MAVSKTTSRSLTVVLVAYAACRGASRPPPAIAPTIQRDAASAERAAVDVAAAPTVLTGSVTFCGYGGQGIMPVDASFDDYVRVIAVVDFIVPAGVFARPLRVHSIEVLADTGHVQARMRALLGVVRMPLSPGPPSWAQALDRYDTPFDGALSPGPHRLRIEAWLSRRPPTTAPSVRIELRAPGLRAVLEGATQGEWPTA